MHLENLEQVAAAFGARDLSIKDLYLRIADLEGARERHVDVITGMTTLIEKLQQRVNDLERRPQPVPYPLFAPMPAVPQSPPWVVTCTGSSYPPNEPKPYPPFGFPY